MCASSLTEAQRLCSIEIGGVFPLPALCWISWNSCPTGTVPEAGSDLTGLAGGGVCFFSGAPSTCQKAGLNWRDPATGTVTCSERVADCEAGDTASRRANELKVATEQRQEKEKHA